MLYLYGTARRDHPRGRPPARRSRGSRPSARTAYYPDGWHILLRDYEATSVWGDMLAFMQDPAAPLPSGVGPIPARPAPMRRHE